MTFRRQMVRRPTRSSPATTSWPTAPSAPGPGSRSPRDPDVRRPPGVRGRPARALGGPARPGLDRLIEHTAGSGAARRDLGRPGRGCARPPASCDLRPVPRSFPIPVVGVPWSEPDEARQLASGQIGVSWLPDDLWSRGKCGLKVLQYQAAGLPVVANPVGCQSEMIRSGEDGILATSPPNGSTPSVSSRATRASATDGGRRPPSRRGGLLDLGVVGRLRPLDDRLAPPCRRRCRLEA